ncbi:ABC transporter permease [Nonomuraea endophytica]|uniref:Peptide/nickel transport system permease protein n=1 Tax=Nonomuraea endophytica TaxID=714136 RepID=A0A7W8AFC8_9ACTN|nr:ABC transporter permease [Nonomuraea endophytica]MBB5084110.1 peptide/nickel transport system permease protein [Nonomuraea endophytica]
MGGRRGRGRMIARFVLRRLLELALTLVAASFLVFGAVHLAPGRPETFLLGGRAASPEALAAIRAQYHLDDPFFLQYLKWAGGVLTGDLGRSMQYRSPVLGLIEARLPSTLLLITMAAVLVVVLGIGLGRLAAVGGPATDSAVLVGTSVALGTPSFVAAIGLLWVFSVQLGWFPTIGSGDGLPDMIYHLTLPSLALALYWTGWLARVTRGAMKDQLALEHVTVARSRGLPERLVIRRHVLRNALGPVATVSGLTLSGLVISTVLVEAAFGIGGLGALLESSVQVKDFPVVQAITLLVVALFTVTNLIVDLCYPLVDPRVRLGVRSDAG